MPGASPAWDSPVFIVRHSGLIICNVEGVYFEAVQREVCLLFIGATMDGMHLQR